MQADEQSGQDPTLLEAIFAGLDDAAAGKPVAESLGRSSAGISLADVLEGLADHIGGEHVLGWYFAAAVSVLLAGFAVYCFPLKGSRDVRSQLAAKERLQAERQRRIQELRAKEIAMKEAGKGQPKADKGPKNPKSSAASQDLHTLARKGNLAGLRRLLERGAEVDTRSKESQKTPLHVACQYGQFNAVKMLVESFGADIEARSAFGRTPLHLAAAQGFPEVVEYLISRNANTKALTPEGSSALGLSQKYSYKKVAMILTPR